MKIAKAYLKSCSPIAFGRRYDLEIPGKEGENKADYEKRTWRNRCHSTADGNILITQGMLMNSLKSAAKYLSISIPGSGKAKYTKNFAAGVLVFESLELPDKIDTVSGMWLDVPSNGQPGGSTRVPKCFPTVQQWEGCVEYHIFDDVITEDVFKRVLVATGKLIGMGALRVQNRGWFGRFNVESFEWQDEAEEVAL